MARARQTAAAWPRWMTSKIGSATGRSPVETAKTMSPSTSACDGLHGAGDAVLRGDGEALELGFGQVRVGRDDGDRRVGDGVLRIVALGAAAIRGSRPGAARCRGRRTRRRSRTGAAQKLARSPTVTVPVPLAPTSAPTVWPERRTSEAEPRPPLRLAVVAPVPQPAVPSGEVVAGGRRARARPRAR